MNDRGVANEENDWSNALLSQLLCAGAARDDTHAMPAVLPDRKDRRVVDALAPVTLFPLRLRIRRVDDMRDDNTMFLDGRYGVPLVKNKKKIGPH